MHRIDAADHSSNMFTDGNPGGGIPATVVDDDWLNAVQEEIVHAILTKAGISLVKGTNTQLGSALDMLMQGIPPGGRLTLETAVGVSTADQAGKTTVYYTPHKHNRIAVYDGTRWVWRTFTEVSQATTDSTKSPAAVANNSNYDVFAWLDSSTLRATRGPAWSSDTARGTGAGTTELEFFEGRWVNKVAITNGPAARCGLYVGTIRSDGSAQINDTLAKRHVDNHYNQEVRPLLVLELTNTWNYSTATLRQMNGSSANQLDVLVGLTPKTVTAAVLGAVSNSTATPRAVKLAIGVDSTTTKSGIMGHAMAPQSDPLQFGTDHTEVLGIGRHFLAALEEGNGTDTQTWYGDNGSATSQYAGITGRVLA